MENNIYKINLLDSDYLMSDEERKELSDFLDRLPLHGFKVKQSELDRVKKTVEEISNTLKADNVELHINDSSVCNATIHIIGTEVQFCDLAKACAILKGVNGAINIEACPDENIHITLTYTLAAQKINNGD